MSNINQTATVTLMANGQQVTSTLNQLKQRAQELEDAFAKAAAAGNKTQMKNIQRELKNTRRQLREMTSSAEQAEAVLRRLDKATPRELNQTLRTLTREMQGMERGSVAWNAHTEKIRMVKGELAKLNSEVRLSENSWERFNRKLNDWQTSLMGIIAAVTGVIMAGRKAVNSFASMEDEMANTLKYTGMTKKDVEELNQAFQKMDTRTSREQLNELAQEAGRLGKNNLKDVLGYVEAADIINVALVDLGAGATQTIAKIANIFGVEQALGTKDAMLSIGSAVNVLSQNCTASKPYLVEFAQRMAGIGAQAGLSVPEILAFGAVLDANGQKVEMSATAIQKVIMKLANSNSELAKQVGLDAKVLNERLKHSAKDGLLMFLEQLHAIGEQGGYENATMSLAPAFKEMGLDAARVATVLSTLAKHIEEVKDQVGNANKAFDEATSATNEYNIFNNTTQAGLDKARKRISELSIELGQKLLPVMKHVMTSTSATIRVLNIMVDFIIKYHKEIVVLTTAVIAYKVAVNASNIMLKAHYAYLVVAEGITKGYTAVVKGLTAAKLALQIALAKLQGNWPKQSSLMLDVKKAGVSLASGWGVVIAAAITLGAALYKLYQKFTEVSKAEKDMQDIRRKGQEGIIDEKRKIESLVATARNEKASLDDRHAAINALNKLIPHYNAQLDATSGKYRENKRALDAYLVSLARKYELEGAKEKLRDIGKERVTIADDKTKQEQFLKKIKSEEKRRKNSNMYNATDINGVRYYMSIGEFGEYNTRQGMIRRRELDLNEREKRITSVYGKDLQQEDLKEFKEKPVTPAPTVTVPSPISTTTTSTGSTAKTDKFEDENNWKKEQEALNRIDYAVGDKKHEDFVKRSLEIEVEYNEKKLKHQDLTETEKLQIMADYSEAQKALTENTSKVTLEEEKKRHEEQKLLITELYLEERIKKDTYDRHIEEEELKHAAEMVKLTKEGTKERLDAETQYAELQIKIQEKRRSETEKKEKEHRERLKKIKEEVFGNNPAENKAAFDADLAVLKEVYAAELAAAGDNAKEKLRIEEAFLKAKIALMKKYNIEGAEEDKVFLQEWNESVVEFLKSDVGGAIQGGLEVLQSSMSAIFSQLSSMVQSELQVQEAALNKRYDREISLAEGNKYKVVALERQKEKELAKLRSEANKKLFAMQVLQAIASTAQGAINAYSSAAQVPLIGYILAPVAAASAIAAGMLQVAAIKKQQQASEATGYYKGGFTPEGRLDEPVGVVHAGEWVASNKLIKSPVARPVINALDYAQRTNTIGSLRSADASRVATPVIVQQTTPVTSIVAPGSDESSHSDDNRYSDTIAELQTAIVSLNRRLEEPFVTVNTVEGDTGIKRAQDEYSRLIKNKTPKSRR